MALSAEDTKEIKLLVVKELMTLNMDVFDYIDKTEKDSRTKEDAAKYMLMIRDALIARHKKVADSAE